MVPRYLKRQWILTESDFNIHKVNGKSMGLDKEMERVTSDMFSIVQHVKKVQEISRIS